MAEMIEVHVVFPSELKILVPKQLLEEISQAVKEEKLSEMITEAITEELKRLRFRADLERARTKK